jgi:hypothetical protein
LEIRYQSTTSARALLHSRLENTGEKEFSYFVIKECPGESPKYSIGK